MTLGRTDLLIMKLLCMGNLIFMSFFLTNKYLRIAYLLTESDCIYKYIQTDRRGQAISLEIINPIRSGMFQTANDLENYFINLHHIIHVIFTMCFRHVPIGIFQKIAILTILQRFQNKK